MGCSARDDEALARIVSGATAFVIDFDGPNTAYIGTDPSHMYVALCSHGIKAEGEEAPKFDSQTAIELYSEQLRSMIKANAGKHLAWRCHPGLEGSFETGGFHVYSRLAFI